MSATAHMAATTCHRPIIERAPCEPGGDPRLSGPERATVPGSPLPPSRDSVVSCLVLMTLLLHVGNVVLTPFCGAQRRICPRSAERRVERWRCLVKFNVPPGWPDPPLGWIPQDSWRPDPQWPEAPTGWRYWVDDNGAPVRGPIGAFGGPVSLKRAGALVGGGLVTALALGSAMGAGSAATTTTVSAPTQTVLGPVITVPGPTMTLPGPTVTATATVTVTIAPTAVDRSQTAGGSTGIQPKTVVSTPKPAASAYYANCAAARAAGVAPLYRGQPGYRSGLDRDNDGVACEWS